MRASSHIAYQPHIDGLRAVAVVLVILFHAFPAAAPGGFVGVDIFFVISGYLITKIILVDIRKRTFSFWEFYSRRIRRIFPALIVVVTSTLLVGWLILLPAEWAQLGKHTAAGAAFFSNFAYMQETGYFDAPAEKKPLLHLWSLGIEEQFYVVWPLLLLLLWRLVPRPLYVLLVTALASFTLGIVTLKSEPVTAFYLTLTRAWELLVGGLLAYASVARPPDATSSLQKKWRLSPKTLSALRDASAAAGLVLLVVAAFGFGRDVAYPGWRALLPTAGAMLLIAAGAPALVNRYVLAHPLLVFVGVISFPLYLWHWPMLSFSHIIEPARSTALVAVLMPVAVLLAWATYRFVEKPARQQGKRTTVLLFYIVAIVGVTGYYIQLARIPSRSSNAEELKEVFAAVNDWEFPSPSMQLFAVNNLIGYRQEGARETALLIGDSNVQQYAPRLVKLVAESPDRMKSVIFATSGGCPPIPNVMEDAHPNCINFTRDAMQIAASSSVDTVIIGAQWLGYFSTGKYYFEVEGVKQPITIGSPGAELAFEALSAFISDLRGAGKKVYLVLNTPIGLSFDPVNSVRRSLFRAQFEVQPRSLPRSSFEHQTREVNSRLIATAVQSGAQVIDPVESLCIGGTCPSTTSDGMFMYKDSTHLRASFVREQVLYLDELVRLR